MKQKIMAWLVVGMLAMAPCSLAEGPIPDQFPPQRVTLEAFTFSIDYDWILEELTPGDIENGVLLKASDVDGSQSLTVFAGGEGDFDAISEQTARDEYAGIVKREKSQVYNDVEIAFTTSGEHASANAYMSLDHTIYTLLLHNTAQGQQGEESRTPLETLQGFLLSLMPQEQ